MRLLSFVVAIILCSNLYASLSYQISDKGIQFFNDNTILVKEFSGTISIKDGQVFYNSIQIGTARDNELKVCRDEYKNICDLSIGFKNSTQDDFVQKSIHSINIFMRKEAKLIGTMNESLIPYVMNSPNQFDAGSCLFMATTGAMELLLNKRNGHPGVLFGDTDLSERFLMNAKKFARIRVSNWRTDKILTFNQLGGAILNRDYRYTMGFYKKDENDNLIEVSEGTEGAKYGPYFNWIADLTFNFRNYLIDVPYVHREIIYKDPAGNQWNSGAMNENHVKMIKQKLDEKNGPVLVIYNHFAYWHAVLIVGYNDNIETEACPFVGRWIEYIKETIDEYMDSGEARDIRKAQRLKGYLNKVETSVRNKGCSTQGVFYVRDSIYTGPEDLIYDYDLMRTGEEKPYAKRIIKRTYDWIKHLANHAYLIY